MSAALYRCSQCDALVTAARIVGHDADADSREDLALSRYGAPYVARCSVCDARWIREMCSSEALRNPTTGRLYAPTSRQHRWKREAVIADLRRTIVWAYRRWYAPERMDLGIEPWEYEIAARLIGAEAKVAG